MRIVLEDIQEYKWCVERTERAFSKFMFDLSDTIADLKADSILSSKEAHDRLSTILDDLESVRDDLENAENLPSKEFFAWGMWEEIADELSSIYELDAEWYTDEKGEESC